MLEFEITQENVLVIVGGATLDLVKKCMMLDGKKAFFMTTVTPVMHALRRISVSLRYTVIEEALHMEKLWATTRQMEPAEWSHLRKYGSAWTQKT